MELGMRLREKEGERGRGRSNGEGREGERREGEEEQRRRERREGKERRGHRIHSYVIYNYVPYLSLYNITQWDYCTLRQYQQSSYFTLHYVEGTFGDTACSFDLLLPTVNIGTCKIHTIIVSIVWQ